MESEARKHKHWFYGDEQVDIVEQNTEEFPTGLLATRLSAAAKRDKRVEFRDTVKDSSSGQWLERRLVISANVDTELPTARDIDVQLAMKVLSHRANRQQFPELVEFTIYQMLKVMKLPNTGENIARVAKSLDNWSGVRFKYSHWWNPDTKCWEEPEAFCLLQHYKLSRKGQGARTPDSAQFFRWGSKFVESIRSARSKPFDSDFYFDLSTPLAKRQYQFLDKRLWDNGFYEKNLRLYAEEKIGTVRNRAPSQIIEKYNPAYDELVAKGFLGNISLKKRFRQKDNGEWVFCCKRGKGKKNRSQVAVPIQAVALKEENGALGELHGELENRGVNRGFGKTESGGIVRDCEESLIRKNCERYDWLVASKKDVTIGLLISETLKGREIKLPSGEKTPSEKTEAKQRREQEKFLESGLKEAAERVSIEYEKIPLEAYEALSEDVQRGVWDSAEQTAPMKSLNQLSKCVPKSRMYESQRNLILQGRFKLLREKMDDKTGEGKAEFSAEEHEWIRRARLVFQRLEQTEDWKTYLNAKVKLDELKKEKA